MKINPLHCIDFYKTGHRSQYPKGTTEVYANFTPRSNKLANVPTDKIVFFGLQYFIKDFLINTWNEDFFEVPKAIVLKKYKRRINYALGKDIISMDHISALHDLGYLPIRIRALSEGTLVPMGVPVLTIVNTNPDFFWLTNYLETILSCYLWKPITSATVAYEYKKLLMHYANKTGTPLDFVQFQAHDFSFRGMCGPQDAASSGAGHALSFNGGDTVVAIDFLEEFYNADAEKEFILGSIPATEHSVICMGQQEGELETFRRLLTEVYPNGLVSLVSDSWDFWKVVTEFMVTLKDKILARDGKCVLRPDSGDPIKILVGDPEALEGSPEYKGAVECLWDIFGGTITETGHKQLDSHIGLIYGDSITYDRAQKILSGLEAKGFASGNVVFGIGSYTYTYCTRDTFGFAIKATSGIVNGERRDIFKDPKTDSGVKKSLRGLLRIERENGILKVHDMQTEAQEAHGLLEPIFEDGVLLKKYSLQEIRNSLVSPK